MPLAEVVRSVNGDLSPSEQRIVNALLREPMAMSQLPAKSVGEQLDVHETTVIRLAKRLGYTGYADLRAELRASATSTETSLERMAPAARQEYTLVRLVEDEVAALERLAGLVPQAEVDALAVVEPFREVLFGDGGVAVGLDGVVVLGAEALFEPGGAPGRKDRGPRGERDTSGEDDRDHEHYRDDDYGLGLHGGYLLCGSCP